MSRTVVHAFHFEKKGALSEQLCGDFNNDLIIHSDKAYFVKYLYYFSDIFHNLFKIRIITLNSEKCKILRYQEQET